MGAMQAAPGPVMQQQQPGGSGAGFKWTEQCVYCFFYQSVSSLAAADVAAECFF
jgi:hypothetical protein